MKPKTNVFGQKILEATRDAAITGLCKVMNRAAEELNNPRREKELTLAEYERGTVAFLQVIISAADIYLDATKEDE